MSDLSKAIFEHLKTKKKYNTLDLHYQEMIRLKEERTNERDMARNEIKQLKEHYDYELDLFIKEKIKLKEEIAELKKELKKRKKVKK